MLAGDTGQAVADTVVSNPSPVQQASPVGAMDAANTAAQLVFLDPAVEDLEQVLSGIIVQHEIVLLDADQNGIDQITKVLAGRRGVRGIHVIAHGESGALMLGNQQINLETLNQQAKQLATWARSLHDQADLLLYGCETGAGNRGTDFIERFAQLTGMDIAASTDITGSKAYGADWDLETHVGQIESQLAVSSAFRSNYQYTLPITIQAAGQRGDEQMQLLINEQVVETWDNVAGDPSNRVFRSFTFDADGISADSIRIAFTNDLYDPGAGIDRNLVVDRIEVDGVTFETEDPSVFSTGTYRSADGLVPGFRERETLHGNGYFQFADTSEPPVEGGFAIINEIHYNPGPDGEVDSDAEFIELFNPGSEDFDLSGASFVGFDLTFENGTILAAGQYAIVAPSLSLAEQQWGVTPLAEFEGGGISGGGELIQLVAADGTIIDEVEYDDSSPWPGAPDGNGPSLELVNPGFDNAVASNWLASEDGPTPASQNSVFAESPVAEISDITLTPGTPLPGQDFAITATIPDATEATLTYKIGFGEDQTIQMANIGNDVWQSVVPGQDAGELVRYRIDSDVAVAPFEGDTINYFGVVVSPTDIVDNNLPVLQWYVDPDEFEQLVTEDFQTNKKLAAVVAYGDQVIDNAEVRVRGNFSRTFDKKGFKFELPDGYLLDLGPWANTPVDEFGIVADWPDDTFTSAQIAWEVFNAETDSPTSSFFTRVEQNGDFFGVYRFQELYDGTWRTANGFDDGEFYQAEDGAWNVDNGFDKKEPDDGDLTNILAARDVLDSPPSAEKTQWIYDNVNIPAAVNYMAMTALIRHGDQFWHNFYMSFDGETERWEMLEWDLDLAWRTGYDLIPGADDPFTTPLPIGSIYMDSVWEVPEFREMYWQRLQTLVDTYLGDEGLIERRNELVELIGETNSDLDFQAWGRWDVFDSDSGREDWENTLQQRRDAFANESRLPGISLSDPQIVINELHYNPLDDDAEFLELYNASEQAVDLSGWTVEGVGLTIDFGTVILPGDYIVFTDNDVRFKQQNAGNVFVGGQYDGGLSGGGEEITLLDTNGVVIDSVEYDDGDPWPETPDGDGFTLALISPELDNTLATSWTASEAINGTPGRANTPATDSTEIRIFAAGAEADEVIELQVNGSTVATFNLADYGALPGDDQSRNFSELVWTGNQAIDVDQVRVLFVNDIYQPDQGTDRNIRVDRIEVNGQVFETESPSTFASGTFVNGVGITEGFLQTERLNANGYFEYAVQQSTEIRVFAAGSTSDETIELEVNGDVVASYTLSDFGGQPGDGDARQFVELPWTTDVALDIDQVRVYFVNDLWNPDEGIDRNVRIDRIEINEASYETEAPSTFSTGTYRQGLLAPGFLESESLHVAGYFQYFA